MAATPDCKKARSTFTEKIQWRDSLHGAIGPTDKEQADDLANGGLRNTARTLSRLSYSVEFGMKLGDAIRHTLSDDMERHRTLGRVESSWVYRTCEAIGSDNEANLRPPPEAVAAAKDAIAMHTNPPPLARELLRRKSMATSSRRGELRPKILTTRSAHGFSMAHRLVFHASLWMLASFLTARLRRNTALRTYSATN